MNYKNYKLEALMLINRYKEQTEELSPIVNDIEDAIKLLDDKECINKHFLNAIWCYYADNMPDFLLWGLLEYTDYSDAKINWEKKENIKIKLVSHVYYKIELPREKVIDLIPSYEGEYFIKTFDITVGFDLSDLKWYLIDDYIYDDNNIYTIEVAKEICKRQYEINETKRKIKEEQQKIKEEIKQKEKEELKRQKELEREAKRKAKEAEKRKKQEEKMAAKMAKASQKNINRSNIALNKLENKINNKELQLNINF